MPPGQMPPGQMPPGLEHMMAMPMHRGRNPLWILLAVLAAGALIAVGLYGAANLRAAAQSKPPNLSAAASNGQPDLSVLSNIKPPSLAAPATRVEMPADVFAWLQHLQECDAYKSQITRNADTELMAAMPGFQSLGGITSPAEVDKLTDPDSNISKAPGADSIDKTIGKIEAQWTALKQKFDSMTPPAECKPVADAYDSGLDSTIKTFQTVQNLVDGINVTDPNLSKNIESSKDSLEQIRDSHKQGVDNMFEQTDMLVQQICDKYNVAKWFKIDSHGGSQDPLSSFGSGLGL